MILLYNIHPIAEIIKQSFIELMKCRTFDFIKGISIESEPHPRIRVQYYGRYKYNNVITKQICYILIVDKPKYFGISRLHYEVKLSQFMYSILVEVI